jgi:hypothetical protein
VIAKETCKFGNTQARQSHAEVRELELKEGPRNTFLKLQIREIREIRGPWGSRTQGLTLHA